MFIACVSLGIAATFKDGYCDEYLNSQQCQFDGGDCAIRIVCNQKCNITSDQDEVSIGTTGLGILNGVCEEALMFEQCCFDGGDCPSPELNCPTCPMALADRHSWLGDKMCDWELNFKACCYDLQDCGCIENETNCDDVFNDARYCQTCPIPLHNRIADGVCDTEYFNEECCMDGNDCEGFRTRCPTCNVDRVNTEAFYISMGDYVCQKELDKQECCFDEGDCALYEAICPTCREYVKRVDPAMLFYFKNLGDGYCDGFDVFDLKECCYDNGDCRIEHICDTCDRSMASYLLNFVCDSTVSNIVQCQL